MVKDRDHFHRDMLEYKVNDYAGLTRYLGSPYLNILNRYIFPAHFNHVMLDTNTKLKYAIIDLQTFLFDLKSWKLLTFAGRLHKPTLFNFLNNPNLPEALTKSIDNNHKMALNIGILNMIGKVRDH